MIEQNSALIDANHWAPCDLTCAQATCRRLVKPAKIECECLILTAKTQRFALLLPQIRCDREATAARDATIFPILIQ